jgi:asparagine synthase (glutamine-hydrolysing)
MSNILKSGYYFLPEYLQIIYRDRQRIGFQFLNEGDKLKKTIKIPKRGGKSYYDLSLSCIQYGLQDLLRYEDRNSMAFSIESRVPFLDHRLVEYSLGLQSSVKLNEGWTKYILRKAIQDVLPSTVVWRKDKKGFITPQREWKKETKQQVKAYLKHAVIPDILDEKFIFEIIDRDNLNNSQLSEYWRIISFIKWTEIFKVKF